MKNFPQTPSYLENKHGTPSDVIKNYVENQGDKEIKRRSRVVGAFPSQESVLRLVVSILIDINEDWIIVNRYIVMEQ